MRPARRGAFAERATVSDLAVLAAGCLPYSPAAGPETTRGGFVAEGARRAFCPRGLVAVVAALACSIAFAAARAPTASAASVQSRINALIRDAIARHGIRAVIFQATKNEAPCMI